MARQTFDKIESFCVVDKNLIPADRLKRGAVTCSKECSKIRSQQQMALVDQVECRYCRRPSTPEERQAYRRFRKLESLRPDLLYPDNFEAWKMLQRDGPITPEAFAEQWRTK